MVSIDTKPIAPDELSLAGPVVIQPRDEMHSEPVTQGWGGVLSATNQHMEVWYHWKTGETSMLPKILHSTYAVKPDFHEEPSAEWHEHQKHTVKCPACQAPIRIIPEVDNTALEALGFKVETPEEESRRFVIQHFKAAHKNTFARMLASGQVSETEAKNL